MIYRYQGSKRFWKSFYALSSAQKASTRAVWFIFKTDPFHPSLRCHKIQHLSAVSNETIHAIWIEGDLRAVFSIRGDVIYTIDIGTHDIYKR